MANTVFSTTTNVTLTGSGLIATASGTAAITQSADFKNSGKLAVQFTFDTVGTNQAVGLAKAGATYVANGSAGGNWAVKVGSNGAVYLNGSATSSGSIGTPAASNTVVVEIDFDTRAVSARLGSGTRITGFLADPAAFLSPAAQFNVSTNKTTLNSGDTTFANAPTTGYTAGWAAPGASTTGLVSQLTTETWVVPTPAAQVSQLTVEVWRTSANLDVSGTGSGALSAITGTASGQFKKKTGGNGGGSTAGSIGAGDKYATKVTMPETGTILSLILESQQAKAVNTRMALYADAGGLPGARIATTGTKASVVVGENEYTLTTPYVVASGQAFWIALQADASINWLLGAQTGGSYSNADAYADGISDPFGPGTVQNNKAPLLAVYIQGSVPSVVSSYTATGSGALASATGTASGKLGVTGTASGSLAITATAAGKLGVTGSGTGTLAALTGAGSGTRTETGTGAGALSSLAGSATGTLGVTGTGSGALVLLGQGVSGGVVVGTASGTLAAITGAGAGTTGTAARRFLSGGGGRAKPQIIRGFQNDQDRLDLWKEPEREPEPVAGTGAGALAALGGRARGAHGHTGAVVAQLLAFAGAARAEHVDTVASDNEFLLLASCRPLHERHATRAHPGGGAVNPLPSGGDVVAAMEWEARFTELA